MTYKLSNRLTFLVLIAMIISGCKKHPAATPGYDFTYTGDNYTYSTITFKSTAGSGSNYSWDFGDGTISTDSVPVHVYKKTDSFVVKLVLNNDTQHPIYKSLVINPITQKFSGNYITIAEYESRQDSPWPLDPSSLITLRAVAPDTFTITGIGDTMLNVTHHYGMLKTSSVYLTDITDSNMVFSLYSEHYQYVNQVIIYNFSTNSLDNYFISTGDYSPIVSILWYKLRKI